MDLSKIDIKFTPSVGSARAEILNKEIGVFTQEDMLYYFPYKYVDRTRFYHISDLDSSLSYIQIRGQFLNYETVGVGKSKRLIANFSDGTGIIKLIWFRGIKYVKDKYLPGTDFVVFGKITKFGSKFNIVHPDIEAASKYIASDVSFLPFYNTTEVMKRKYLNSKAIQKIIYIIIENLKGKIDETFPSYITEKYNLMPLHDAIIEIHKPTNSKNIKQARYRLSFEELFYLQLNILRYSKEREKKFIGYKFGKVGKYFNDFYYNHLPFELTGAQKKVIKEIRGDMGRNIQMNRLLQGDVGSGKTLVALMTMLIAKDNGYQSCLMAPTEILANQHLETLRELLGDMEVNVDLLTGSIKKKDRVPLFERLEHGDIDILVGTHALIEDSVKFKDLGFVVIDEQHRFGVAQRSRLWKKNDNPPHILVMTATPIPRTLAMTVYGDLDVSVIDELPPGRKPINTIHAYDNKVGKITDFVRKELQMGRQVYYVFPLIQESENLDYKNLEEGFVNIVEAFPEVKVSMVHGKMKPAEKEHNMQLFASGETKILVSTTVIEVGVNVPNASVMVIESAERFGLSQLHQLRGRVGRGVNQSYCVLVTSYKLSEDSRKRMEIMTSSNDGFEIAEADLKLRGPGDMEGTQQSGIAFDLKISNITRDAEILSYVRDIAKETLEQDPDLKLSKNILLKNKLNKLFAKKINWGSIS